MELAITHQAKRIAIGDVQSKLSSVFAIVSRIDLGCCIKPGVRVLCCFLYKDISTSGSYHVITCITITVALRAPHEPVCTVLNSVKFSC